MLPDLIEMHSISNVLNFVGACSQNLAECSGSNSYYFEWLFEYPLRYETHWLQWKTYRNGNYNQPKSSKFLNAKEFTNGSEKGRKIDIDIANAWVCNVYGSIGSLCAGCAWCLCHVIANRIQIVTPQHRCVLWGCILSK